MAKADPQTCFSLAAAMGKLFCIHGNRFPCGQCRANRSWNAAATREKLTDAEFEKAYVYVAPPPEGRGV
jgi:hypothetical protein